MGPVRLFMGHPGPPRIAKNAIFFILWPIYEKQVVIFFPCYTYVCSVMMSYCPEICPEKNVYFSYFGFKLQNFLSDCSLIWRVPRYGWEDSWKAREAQSDHPLRAPQIAQNIHIFLHLARIWKTGFQIVSPCCTCLYCDEVCICWHFGAPATLGFYKGPTWPRNYFFIFFILTEKGSCQIVSIFDM